MDAHPRMLSNRKFHIILFMKNNGNITTFKEQNIYKHNASFKRAMKELHIKKLVMIKQQRIGNLYKLTNFGEHLGMMLDELAS